MSESIPSNVHEEISTEDQEKSATPLRRSTSTVSTDSRRSPEKPPPELEDAHIISTLSAQDPDDMQGVSREAMMEKAQVLQASLLEIAESIELVKADHDKLEKQNLALQDYIGGLTRAMSKGQAPKRTKGSGK